MMTTGIIVLSIGLLWAAFKGYVVWDITRDVFNGGGAPTLDFPIICPIPLAVGGSLVLSALGKYPFPGFGFVAYVCLAVVFGFLLWLFRRLGEPERQRRLQALKQRNASANEPNA
jgi:hypothetical protein